MASYFIQHDKGKYWSDFYAPAIFNGGAYSITAVRTYVRPVHNTFGFRAISFERIGVLD